MKNSIICLIIVLFQFNATISIAQEKNQDLNLLKGIPLDSGQVKLEQWGFEIAHSSLFGHEQLWWNQTKNQCIKIIFSKEKSHQIKSFEDGEKDKCIKGAELGRLVWEKYHDGQSDVSSTAIDKEREKLKSKGYIVSYWIYDIAPGRSTEYWSNETDKKCMHIIWNTIDKGDVETSSWEEKYAKNPAPKKN